jgi:hypothetical protein
MCYQRLELVVPIVLEEVGLCSITNYECRIRNRVRM